jgi:hypothetical protein
MPVSLSAALQSVVSITDRLDAYDYSTRTRQVQRMRTDMKIAGKLTPARRKSTTLSC